MAAARQRRGEPQADVDRPCDITLEAQEPRTAAQPAPRRSRQQRVQAVRRDRHCHEDEAQDEELQANMAFPCVHELG